jgi:hypothetical protein
MEVAAPESVATTENAEYTDRKGKVTNKNVPRNY